MQHESHSPFSPLANWFFSVDPTPELVIISGPSGSGKTTACIGFSEHLRTLGVGQAGLISPPVIEDNQKIAIDLKAIHTGEKRQLARLLTAAEHPTKEPADSDLVLGKWRFDPDAFTWGNSILSHLPNGECFIIDELGPLEFRLGEGLQAGMTLLDNRTLNPAFVVVREELLPAAVKRWPWSVVLNLPHNDSQEPPGRESR